jgi:dipeptidyl aminopeptidase/acylaminoacyl peptidase
MRVMVVAAVVFAFACRSTAAVPETPVLPVEEPGPAVVTTPVFADSEYARARKAFHTTLVRKAPSPQPFVKTEPPVDAREIAYASPAGTLHAWISSAPKPGVRAPAVMFLHGGFAFGADDWEMAKPFRDAGFIVMVPTLRGENGEPGAFTLFYDEVDDVLAATEVLAIQPDVDPSRIFVAGHSAGGILALLAAMTSQRFRAAASLSGAPDASALLGQPMLVPFDPESEAEIRMRSPLQFATSLQCPTRLFYGNEEDWLEAPSTETVQRGKAAGIDVETIAVPGDHLSMVEAAIPLAVVFFKRRE